MDAVINPTNGTPLTYLLPALSCLLSVRQDQQEGQKSYDNYQVFRLNTSLASSSAFKTLEELYDNDVLFDFLTRPNRKFTDVVLCPEQVENVKNFFETVGIEYTILANDLGREIRSEQLKNSRILGRAGGSMNWEAYHDYETIQSWMNSTAARYPALVKMETYGYSSEGRPMRVMRISTGGSNSTKPAVWLDGGIHAREWISPAAVTFIANELISQLVSTGPDYDLISKVDWYIQPNMNPDGYVYSHRSDRMWRKTRSNDYSFMANAFGCRGTDPNRNWSYKWGGKGTSGNACSQIYRGRKPASEPEVASTQEFIYQKRDEIKLFITFHSYSQMIFTPWGYDYVDLPDKQDLMTVGRQAAQELENVHGTLYQVGSSPELLYPAAGGTEDYARGIAGIKFSYCYELRDTGKHAFMLPVEQIKPTGQETYASVVKGMLRGVLKYYESNP